MLRSSRCSSVACIALATLAACDANDSVCTANFALVGVVAVTPEGMPVSGLTIRDTVIRTGHGFLVEQWAGTAPGHYIIFSDSYGRELGRRKDLVKVTGRDATRIFTALYELEAGDCHISKIAGPDTVIVTPWMAPD